MPPLVNEIAVLRRVDYEDPFDPASLPANETPTEKEMAELMALPSGPRIEILGWVPAAHAERMLAQARKGVVLYRAADGADYPMFEAMTIARFLGWSTDHV